MLTYDQVQQMRAQPRRIIRTPGEDEEELGPLQRLPGTWKGEGRGWNMIALPFATEPDSRLNYRLLLNHYDETLEFTLVDKGVPNRGIRRTGTTIEADQFLATLDYEQSITQQKAEDFPVSGDAGGAQLAIHHEPGLWLHMANEALPGLDVARLATIPHGNSVLALGSSHEIDGAPAIPGVNGLPIGVNQDVDNNPYLEPYKRFHDNPFKGTVNAPEFPGFDPVNPHALLELANQGITIDKTTVLDVDTTLETGGIVNIPFIERQADASEMRSIFWIQELPEKGRSGRSKLRLQYLQIVFLDFFPRRDGQPGLIRWPHVSINTLEKED